MNAAWWTEFGAMAVPIGVVLMIAKPERAGFAMWVVILGFAFAIIGLAFTVREHKEKREREKARAKQEIASFLVLTHIASALGVDMNEVLKEKKALLNEEE